MTTEVDIQNSVSTSARNDAAHTVAASVSEAETFSWRAHPAQERPNHALWAAVAILGMAAAVYFSFDSVAWAVVSLVVLVVALNRFYFPSTFTIDDTGILARYPLRRKQVRWDRIRRFVHDEHGGYLSTRATISRLDAFRGIHILFGNDRGAVVGRIRSHLKIQERSA